MKKRVLPVLLALGVVLGQAQGVYAAVEEAPQAAVEEATKAVEEAPEAAEEVGQAKAEEVSQAAAEVTQAAVKEAIPETKNAVQTAAEEAPVASAAEEEQKNAQDGQHRTGRTKMSGSITQRTIVFLM